MVLLEEQKPVTDGQKKEETLDGKKYSIFTIITLKKQIKIIMLI